MSLADTGIASYFKPRRLGHVNLWVDDLGRSERSLLLVDRDGPLSEWYVRRGSRPDPAQAQIPLAWAV